jgi:bacterial/archaeal transporter family-2 protein
MNTVMGYAMSLLGVLAGVSFVVQQAANSALRITIGSGLWAAFFSYLGGTLTMAMVLVVARESLPPSAIPGVDWWMWSGGVFGVVYIVISIFVLPRLGAAGVVGLIVAGQLLASLIVDHFGLLGVAYHPASAPRVLGAVCLIAGAILVRL